MKNIFYNQGISLNQKGMEKYNKAVKYLSSTSNNSMKLQHSLGGKYPLLDINSLIKRYNINIESLRTIKKELKELIVLTNSITNIAEGKFRDACVNTTDNIKGVLKFLDTYEKLVDVAKQEKQSAYWLEEELSKYTDFENPILTPHLRGVFPHRTVLIEMYNHYKWFNTTRKAYRMNVNWSNFILNSLTKDLDLNVLENLPYDNFVLCLDGVRDTDYSIMYIDVDRKKKEIYANVRSFKVTADEDGDYIEGVGALSFNYNTKIGEILKNLEYTYTNDNTLPQTMLNPVLRSFFHMSFYDTNTGDTFIVGQDKNYCNSDAVQFIDENNTRTFRDGIYLLEAFGKPCVFNTPLVDESTDALGFPYRQEYMDDVKGNSISLILSSLVYLATENAITEIKRKESIKTAPKEKSTNSQKEHKKSSKPQTEDIKAIDVAVKETEYYIKLRNAENNVGAGKGNRTGSSTHKRKHIRKGHYHSYWVGKKDSPDRHIILKFLMPVLVGKDNPDEELTVNLMNINAEKQVKEIMSMNEVESKNDDRNK